METLIDQVATRASSAPCEGYRADKLSGRCHQFLQFAGTALFDSLQHQLMNAPHYRHGQFR